MTGLSSSVDKEATTESDSTDGTPKGVLPLFPNMEDNNSNVRGESSAPHTQSSPTDGPNTDNTSPMNHMNPMMGMGMNPWNMMGSSAPNSAFAGSANNMFNPSMMMNPMMNMMQMWQQQMACMQLGQPR
jgi:hypothetical protein